MTVQVRINSRSFDALAFYFRSAMWVTFVRECENYSAFLSLLRSAWDALLINCTGSVALAAV